MCEAKTIRCPTRSPQQHVRRGEQWHAEAGAEQPGPEGVRGAERTSGAGADGGGEELPAGAAAACQVRTC